MTSSYRPQMSQASAGLTHPVTAIDERGRASTLHIPAERPLTVYVDKRELVTLMTLGAHPEWLVLGYLRNQRLVRSVAEVESVTVDWEVGSAAVKTRGGIERIEERTSKRVVTTGCGQGSVFGALMDEVESLRLPRHPNRPSPIRSHRAHARDAGCAGSRAPAIPDARPASSA